MFCSVSTRKSGSSWLDRIRTAKGFPENEATDLENFLQNLSTSEAETLDRCPTSVPNFNPNRNEDKQIFNAMSDVLHELFNFGDNCGHSASIKKSVRKQPNPRVCAFPNNGSDETTNAASNKATVLRSGDNTSGVEGVKEVGKRRNELEEEGDGKDWNLPGFSKTEVTVIDTSYECWKFEKLLFKKKNVWKVRDKKGKSNVWSKKKRRGGMEVECVSGGKKKKVDMEGGGGEMTDFRVNEGNHLSDKSEAHEKAPDKDGKVLKKK